MISLNYRDSRPIYEQIRDGLRKLIVTGALSADEKLPSVRALAAQLAINPNTIQHLLIWICFFFLFRKYTWQKITVQQFSPSQCILFIWIRWVYSYYRLKIHVIVCIMTAYQQKHGFCSKQSEFLQVSRAVIRSPASCRNI